MLIANGQPSVRAVGKMQIVLIHKLWSTPHATVLRFFAREPCCLVAYVACVAALMIGNGKSRPRSFVTCTETGRLSDWIFSGLCLGTLWAIINRVFITLRFS